MKRRHLLLAAGIVGALGLAPPVLAQDMSGLEPSLQAMVPGHYRMGVEVRDPQGFDVHMHTGFWGTMAAYFPDQDMAISVAVTRQQSRALFRVFVDALRLLEESLSRASRG